MKVHVYIILSFVLTVSGKSSQPNIVLIVADDYGWHDVGYHGSVIKTPTLDKLAAQGVKLENYYVQPICSPSRSQLLSGRYQIHTGLQHGIIESPQRNGLPLNIPTLANKMKEAGYSTHMIGKWHLGFFKKEYTPTYRGFDTFYGFLSGGEDHYTHIMCHNIKDSDDSKVCGTDLRDNTDVVWNNTDYSAHLFSQQAIKVIDNHDSDQPLFMYIPFQSVHSPLEVPIQYEKMYSFIKDDNRRKYAGMVTYMDEAIANITDALKNNKLWDNTLLVFSTDNGGQIHSGGNNWPLRGWKRSLWEGGLHGIGFVWGSMLQKRGVNNTELVHISDWFPTLLHVAGGSTAGLQLDGYNVWDTISNGSPSPRKEILHNIDPLQDPKGKKHFPNTFDTRVRAAIRSGNWKLITGDPGESGWIPPPTSGLQSIMTVEDNPHKNIWLFDIQKDPNEHKDLSKVHADIVLELLDKLAAYNKTAVPCRFPEFDPESNPNLHGGAWGPWVQ